jgi:hypothetical protein
MIHNQERRQPVSYQAANSVCAQRRIAAASPTNETKGARRRCELALCKHLSIMSLNVLVKRHANRLPPDVQRSRKTCNQVPVAGETSGVALRIRGRPVPETEHPSSATPHWLNSIECTVRSNRTNPKLTAWPPALRFGSGDRPDNLRRKSRRGSCPQSLSARRPPFPAQHTPLAFGAGAA